jgi:hypothetical protein
MKHHGELNTHHLSTSLKPIQKTSSLPSNGDAVSRLPQYTRTSDFDSDSTSTLSKSPTSPTTPSNKVPSHHVPLTEPTTITQIEGVEVIPGEFSRPGGGRRRPSGGSRSHKEFQYYGRHANSWLFNDWSLTDAVKRGWGRVVKRDEE